MPCGRCSWPHPTPPPGQGSQRRSRLLVVSATATTTPQPRVEALLAALRAGGVCSSSRAQLVSAWSRLGTDFLAAEVRAWLPAAMHHAALLL